MGLIQPYALYLMGHSAVSSNYESLLGTILATAISDVGQPLKTLHCLVPRLAGSAGTPATGTTYDGMRDMRDATRARIANNPSTDWFAAHPSTVKNDTSDTGPHPADLDVGQGRSGALLAWGLMMWCRASPSPSRQSRRSPGAPSTSWCSARSMPDFNKGDHLD